MFYCCCLCIFKLVCKPIRIRFGVFFLSYPLPELVPFICAKYRGCRAVVTNVVWWLTSSVGCKTPRWPWEENWIQALKISSCEIKPVSMLFLMLNELCVCFAGKKSTSLPAIDKRTKCLYTRERSKFVVSWVRWVVAFKMEIPKDSFMILLVPWYPGELLCKQKQWFLWSRCQWVRTALPFRTSGAVWHLFGCQHSWRQPWVLALLFSWGMITYYS